ncbi:hypothetical protein DN826_16170 [Stutzerimonas nosocomialis]|uniref:DUF3509 domain-containing protein n=1 Tax=Stutzerimonas nosocomialis TaxID=1056496 RepID=A0A5R9QAR0_9GAMM|nr:hypothetical protein [Stutzerimonas nosocomialis]TLX53966.1 hypothetical protein DN826_16170 [Stutzerimonas nosocomialis]TLX62080.1 hypothetical protein DN820_17875 [Stutzerimonas nosocomialis]
MKHALHLSLDEATRISEMAFLPLRAITQSDLDDASYSLRVEDACGEPVLSIAHIARSQYADAAQLAAILDKARLELSKDGHHLAPWSMPYQPGVAGN